MKIWNVKFNYAISIEADTIEEAKEKASDAWYEIAPIADEMDIAITKSEE